MDMQSTSLMMVSDMLECRFAGLFGRLAGDELVTITLDHMEEDTVEDHVVLHTVLAWQCCSMCVLY